MLTLTYPGKIPAADIVGRFMGPDYCGGYVQAVAVGHGNGLMKGYTIVKFRPVPPGEPRATRDGFGQWWLPLPGEVAA